MGVVGVSCCLIHAPFPSPLPRHDLAMTAKRVVNAFYRFAFGPDLCILITICENRTEIWSTSHRGCVTHPLCEVDQILGVCKQQHPPPVSTSPVCSLYAVFARPMPPAAVFCLFAEFVDWVGDHVRPPQGRTIHVEQLNSTFDWRSP